MSVNYSVEIIVGAEVEINKEVHKKEITKYNENTGKPYTKMVDDYVTYTIFGKKFDDQEDFYDLIRSIDLEDYYGYDVSVVGVGISSVEPNQVVSLENCEKTINDVKEKFKSIGLDENLVSVVVLFSVG